MNAEIGPKDAGEALADAAVVPSQGILRESDLELDLDRGELRVGGVAVPVRPKTFALLTYLAAHPHRLLTKDVLMQAVWPDVVVTDDSLVQCVSELRSALGHRHQGLIKTVPRRGYLFDAAFAVAPRQAQDGGAGDPADRAVAVSPAKPDRGWPRKLIAAVLLIVVIGAGAVAGRWVSDVVSEGEVNLLGRNSVAILPLADLGDANASSLADAVTEDLIVDVSRLPDTYVIAKASANIFAGRDLDVRAIRRRLNVAYVLSGSARRRGDAVSIAVQLHATDSGALVWSERFDYPQHAGWNWQRDITARIANSMNVRMDRSLVSVELPNAGRAPSAIDATLEGFHLLRRIHMRDGPPKSRALFEQALAADPAAAPALTGIALSYVTEVFNRTSETPEADVAKAALAVEKAIALLPNDPRTNYVRSLVLYAQGRVDEAEQVTQRVLQLYPNQPRALQRLGFLRLQQGRLSEVMEPVQLSLRLDPLNAEQVGLSYFTLGMAEFHLGNDDAAYAHMRRAVAASPQNSFAWQWMAAIDGLHGRMDQAKINLAEYRKGGVGLTIEGLKASEPSRNATFWAGRDRFYDGLHKAGLPLSATTETR